MPSPLQFGNCLFALCFKAYSNGLADRHYKQMLMKKVWVAWHSVIEVKWRERVERACQARAEEVCLRLSADYERKIEEVSYSFLLYEQALIF